MLPSDFFRKAYPAAVESGHIWPEFAACEAALESAWGESKLARLSCNLFGQKSGFTTQNYPTIEIQTQEYIKGQNVTVPAVWPAFPDWRTSFSERMNLLRKKQDYAPALAAKSGPEFVLSVSRIWATDPERGNKVLSIWRSHWPKDFPHIAVDASATAE